MSAGNDANSEGRTHKSVLKAVDGLVDLIQKNKNAKKPPLVLSHYRELPASVEQGYELLNQGAELVHATSTKYTLVGKISQVEQSKLSNELLRGCEVIATATLVLLEDGTGCSRSVRHTVSRAALSVLINVANLVKSFDNNSAMEGSVGAQKTGAVWQSCDYIIKRMLPRGNRNAMCRELFSWTKDCQETMTEFQDMIDLGPGDKDDVDVASDAAGEHEDYFGGNGDEDRYSQEEFNLAKACLPIMKCSKGTMNATLQACEALGNTQRPGYGDDSLAFINDIVELSRTVGVGITDFGSLLYPPISDALEDVRRLARRQCAGIVAVHDRIIGSNAVPSDVVDLSKRIHSMVGVREQELLTAIDELLARRSEQ